jgi:hypothetical protein
MWDQLSYDVSTFELTSSNCVNQQWETWLSCESIKETPNHDLTQALVESYAPLSLSNAINEKNLLILYFVI